MTYRIPLGPFELYRRIGKGGMGEVWEGLHIPQQVPVAVKVLTAADARRVSFAEAFHTEVRAAAALNHPGIVTLLDFGELPAAAADSSDGLFAPGSPYIVMELARRGCLSRFQHSLSWWELKAILIAVLDALAHAHACGVIHRDLKPANILVGCGAEDELGIALSDFGLAHALDHQESGQPQDAGWGTPHFMAPEQFRGAWREYGPWTDLYALGITAFHLASGQYPFEAPSADRLGLAHTLAAPAAFAPAVEVPDGFEEWILRLIQKRPEERFQCAADAAWALQRLADPAGAQVGDASVALLPSSDTDGHHRASTAPPVSDAGDDGPATLIDQPDATRLLAPLVGAARSSAAETSMAANGGGGDAPPMPATWRTDRDRPSSPKLLGVGLGLFGLRTLPMVDRDEQRDVLWHTLRAVREEGTARAVLLQGPAGTGKSWLARWICQRANEVGAATVLRAAFSPIAGPTDDLARMVSHHLRAGGLDYEQTVAHVGAALRRYGVRDDVEVQALSDLLMPIARVRSSSEVMSIRVNAKVLRYGLLYRHLQRLAAERPVIVWFDDVQWSADALAFTQFVLERQHLVRAPILLVMTARDEALAARPMESRLVAALTGNRRMRALPISALDDSYTEELVRELLFLSPSLADEVERRCGGNPLFAVQLVGDWVAGDLLRYGREGFELRPDATPEIPDDLHAIWRERLDLLLGRRRAEDIVPLEIAAALGNSVDTDEWHRACAQFGAQPPVDLLRELLASGLARSNDTGFDFCHGLFRESLERNAREADRWRAINTACLRMLEARYPHRQFPYAERYAFHVQEADSPHLAVAALLDAAVARLRRSEFAMATSLLEQRREILVRLDDPQDSVDRAAGWTVEAQVALWRGQLQHAEALASRASAAAHAGGRSDLLGRASLCEGRAALFRGDLQRAEQLLRRAIDAMREAPDEAGEGECLLALARVAESRGDFDAATRLLDEARTIVVRIGHRLGEAQCLNALGDIARRRLQYLEARRHSCDARRIFEDLHNTIGVADCTNDLGELCRLEGDLDGALEHCSNALRMYESLGSEHSMHVRTNLALVRAAQGDDVLARELLEEVRERFAATEQPGPSASSMLLSLPILARLGEFEALRQSFEEAAPLLRTSGIKGHDLLVAALQAIELLDDAGRSELGQRIRDFAREALT